MNAPADCRRCGVCCFSPADAYVRVTGDDWSRLGERADEIAHFIGHRAFMRMRDGHCAALEVRREATGEADYFCAIYERRPQICRDLARGSPECAGERETKGGPGKEPENSVETIGMRTPSCRCLSVFICGSTA